MQKLEDTTTESKSNIKFPCHYSMRCDQELRDYIDQLIALEGRESAADIIRSILKDRLPLETKFQKTKLKRGTDAA
jgi:hypothetical protein